MSPGIFYLPEYHNFEYIGIAPWPNILTEYQQDWIYAIETLEAWLNRYCGAHYSNWAYGQQSNQEYWQACIAFKQAKHCTLFLLTWSS